MTTRPLTESDRARLVRLCGMLGSDHAGERASAAMMAARLVRDHGMTWADVIRGVERTSDPPARTPTPAAPHVVLARELERHGGKVLSAWDRAFIDEIKQIDNPSEAQLARLRQIAAKAATARRSAA